MRRGSAIPRYARRHSPPFIRRAAGLADIISCDPGGTSFDVSLIAGGGGRAGAANLHRLDVGVACAAIVNTVRTPLGLTAEDAAEAILRVANARTAGGHARVRVYRSLDRSALSTVLEAGKE